jgi:hypothetical protein
MIKIKKVKKFDYCKGCSLYENNFIICHNFYNYDKSCPCMQCVVKSMCKDRGKYFKRSGNYINKCEKRENWLFSKARDKRVNDIVENNNVKVLWSE